MRLDDATIEKWRWRARCDPQPGDILDEQGSEAAEVFHLRIGRLLVATNSPAGDLVVGEGHARRADPRGRRGAITRRVPRVGDVLDQRRPDT